MLAYSLHCLVSALKSEFFGRNEIDESDSFLSWLNFLVKFRSDKSAKHNQSEEKKLKVRHSNVVLKTEQNACIQRIKH